MEDTTRSTGVGGINLMQLPSVDVFIGLFFLVGIAYGFLLQREKTITTLCSIYMGLVIANSFSKTLYDFFNGNSTIANQVWIRGNASISTISIVLFLLSIILISASINSRNKKSDEISLLEVIVYSFLMVALILSSILGFLPELTRIHYREVSQAAEILWDYRTLFVLAPPVMLVVLNWKKKEK
jgi:hypothetical protein